jgi:hypothetical protein
MLSREELIDLVASIQNAEGTEEEIDEKLTLLKANVPDPNVLNLIFHAELSPEEVVDKAMSYKPILL